MANAMTAPERLALEACKPWLRSSPLDAAIAGAAGSDVH
jgi:hypothetical protein